MKEFEIKVTVVLLAAVNTGLISCTLLPRLFEFHGGFLTRHEAAQVCRKRGGMLATIYDVGTIPELELDIYPLSNVKFWMGLSANSSGHWNWENGSPLTWDNWSPTNPGAGNCAISSVVYRYFWSKEDCQSMYPYLCEFQTGTCNYTKLPESSILGNNLRMVYGKTPEQCMEICSQVTDFTCRSFEFNIQLKYCQLSSGNKWTLEGYLQNNDPYYDYYHRACNRGVLYQGAPSGSVIFPTSTFLPSSSPSPVPSSSPIIIETSFSSLEESSTSVYVTPTLVWDIYTSKLIICTEYESDLYSSTIYPSTTYIGMVSATTLAPVQQAIVQLEETFKVVKEKARQKTKVSVADDRPSASTVGYVAGFIMFGVLGAVIILDLGSIFRDLKLLKRNFRARHHRRKPTKVILTFDKNGYSKNMNGQKETDIYITDKETEFIEPMEKDTEPEPDYDLPPSEVFSRPRLPRMLSQPSIGEHTYSFSSSRSTENFYEDPTSVLSKSPTIRNYQPTGITNEFNSTQPEHENNPPS